MVAQDFAGLAHPVPYNVLCGPSKLKESPGTEDSEVSTVLPQHGMHQAGRGAAPSAGRSFELTAPSQFAVGRQAVRKPTSHIRTVNTRFRRSFLVPMPCAQGKSYESTPGSSRKTLIMSLRRSTLSHDGGLEDLLTIHKTPCNSASIAEWHALSDEMDLITRQARNIDIVNITNLADPGEGRPIVLPV